MTSARLHVDNLSFSYDGRSVLSGLDLDIEGGEVIAVMGPSGCGKTTFARLVAGFLAPTAGTITLGDDELVGLRQFVPPHRRGIGLVPQEGALFPHLDIAANVGFGLARSQAGRADRISTCLELVGMGDRLHDRPAQLSGGQQQRVAVARALAPRPRLIILDEPFSALDSALRATTRSLVLDAIRQEGATAILVTHDSHEALASAERVAVLEHGAVAQIASPAELYDRPVSLSVARTCGPMSDVSALLDEPRDGSTWVRPHDITVARSEIPDATAAQVVDVRIDGPDAWVTCRIAGSGRDNDVTAAVRRPTDLRTGDDVWLQIDGVGLFEPDEQEARP